MKNITKALLASTVLLTASVPVTAAVSDDLVREVYSAAGGSNFRVSVEGDTVILSGYVEDAYAKGRAEYAAKEAGAERVINRLFVE